MADEVAESAPAETPQTDTPETKEPEGNDTGIFPEKTAPKPDTEESAPSTEDKSESKDESVSASDAAERSDREKRIDESVKRLAIENRELKRQMRTFQSNQQQQQPRLMQPPARPKLEEFEDIGKYNEALEKYDSDSKQFAVQQDRMARDAEARQQAEQKRMQDLRSDWDKKCARIAKSNPDFNTEQALTRVEPSPTMDGFFVDSDVGPELLHYLDENPEEADRIREMPPYKAVRELVRLEDQLSNQVKGIKAKPSVVKPPGMVTGRAGAPAAPKTAADILYG